MNTLCVCSAKALSKYTEMVDNLIRQQKDKLEAASDDARLRLREWDMPEALQASHTPSTISPCHRGPSFIPALGCHGCAHASLVAEAARQESAYARVYQHLAAQQLLRLRAAPQSHGHPYVCSSQEV